MTRQKLLLLGICYQLLSGSPLIAQENTERSATRDQRSPTQQNGPSGVSVQTRITTLDGKELDASDPDSPVQIIQLPGDRGEPNRVEFRIDSLVNKNSDREIRRSPTEEPTTMRQVRIGDYKTDGVLMMGDMWQSMASQLLSRFLGPVELQTLAADETLGDFAKKNGITEQELRMLHPIMSFDKRDQDLPVCVDLTHRVLPGETLDFLADLYQTDVETLKTLNSIKTDREIVWRDLRVPVVMEMGRLGLSCYVVMYDPPGREPSFNLKDYVQKTHRVTEGESLDSIAKQYGISEKTLRLINDLTKDEDLSRDQTLVVQSQLKLAKTVKPEWLVHAIDTQLDVELERVLTLNQLKSPEEFLGDSVITIPAINVTKSSENKS